ncbi:putative hydrolase R7-like protein [Cladobotryum mycophilum]|uniref:Hydrolase R7-like protein n=1 Tax=Cladobotryum mycophilum TaxID=491253 RepID=A0ABR0SFI9_9HYPO
MSSDKPIICVIHGAWHQPLHYAGLINPLRRDGYTVLAPCLASTGAENKDIRGKTLHDDTTVVVKSIEMAMLNGREIVLVAHSYGALVATEVAAKQSTEERAARGLNGGIRGIVYISAILFPEIGMSSWDVLFSGGNDIPPWLTVQRTDSFVNNPMIFYNDVDKPLAEICSFTLVRQSLASVKQGVHHVASEIKARKIFVACSQAQNNPLETQLAMAKMAGAEVEILDSSHSPFLVGSQIPELLRIIKSI